MNVCFIGTVVLSNHFNSQFAKKSTYQRATSSVKDFSTWYIQDVPYNPDCHCFCVATASKDPTLFPDSICLPLPGCNIDGRKIILSRPGLHDPSETSLDEVAMALFMLIDLWMLEDEEASVRGVVMVEDFKAMTLTHLASFTPALAKKMSTLFQVLVKKNMA